MNENNTHPTDDAVNKIEYADTCSKESSIYPPPYYADSGGLYVEVISKTGATMKKLCNFLPRIISELTVDDGTRTTKSYRIGGTDEFGNALPEVDVPATELEKMIWIQNNWKASCDLCVVGQVEKHVRFAIKSTSQYAEQKYFFGYTGWKKIDGEWQYLLPGNPKYSVMLGGKSGSYKIADRVEETDLAYLAGFLQLDFIPQEVMYPCLALVFLSPLNEFLNQAGYEPKFVFMLVGTTGAMKSTVAALMLSFFGSFTPARLPMSFHDTPNSIMYTAGILKDVLTCVDDYHPTARKDSGIMQQTMQTIARSYGDRTTRERLTSDIQLRESRVPHGNPYCWSKKTVKQMLTNQTYVGDTVNFKTYSKSNKLKKRLKNAPENMLIFENTHEAIIDRKTFDIVQKHFEGRKRPDKQGEMDKYAGYLFCGECGSKLYLHRAYSLTESQNNFMCGGYQGKKIDCTAHYIRECVLDQIILEKLREVTSFARENPDEFYALATQNGEAEAKKFYQTAEKEKRRIKRRGL